MRKLDKAAKWAARSERLSAALRENLKRRKAQARGRAVLPDGDAAVGADDAACASENAETPQPETPDFRRNRSNE